MKKIFILSPCGTSILTNSATNNERALITKYGNVKDKNEIPQEDLKALESLIGNISKRLPNENKINAKKLSAELNAVIRLIDEAPDGIYQHELLCTDTWLGGETANLVKVWLEKEKQSVHIRKQSDLQTQNLDAFHIALSDIVKWCDEELKNWRGSGYKIIFNLTGGFKSVQGFLQTLAMFYADEAVYIFESGTELLRIPKLPVKMVSADYIRDNLSTFRRLSVNLPVQEIVNMPETFLLRSGKDITLSAWGELVWNQHKREIYIEELYVSPSSLIQYGDDFKKTTAKLEKDRLYQINSKIDDLARYLETQGQTHQASLDLKKLKTQIGKSTHELDAWADKDAKRIFGHFQEGSIFMLDKLDSGLH